MTGAGDRWVADPRIAWRILLTAELEGAPDLAELDRRMAALYDEQGWRDAPAARTAGEAAALRAGLTGDDPAPVVAGVAGSHLVVSAHHGRVDGLGLLQALAALLAGPVVSSARGVGERPTTGSAVRTALGRLGEVVARPPARLRPVAPGRRATGRDVMVHRDVPGRWRTADLVHAGARGVVDLESARGRPAHRVAVAVGGSRTPVVGERRIADRSVLLRLRGVERLDRGAVADLLATAPVQTPPAIGSPGPAGRALDRVTAGGLRLLAPRLGSTLLVSHLGRVTAPPAVQRLVFHPVTAGGSGLALGAVTVAGRTGADRTTLSLRGREGPWDSDGLERLLEAIARRL